MIKFAAFAMAVAGVAAPAMAQDAPAENVFGGVKIAAVGGLDQAKTNNPRIKGDGAVYGGTLGFDIQSGSFVFGGEVEGTLSSSDGCTPFTTAATTVCIEAKRDLYAGGRLGLVVADSTLLYVKAGYTNARIKGSLGGVSFGSEDLDGVRGGVGLELTGDSGFFGRIEYRYSNYEADTIRHQGVGVLGFRF